MINNVEIVLDNNTLISYDTERGTEYLNFSVIQPFWNYADKDEIEGVRVYTLDDQETLILLLSIASGQGGVVIGWNTVQRCIEHISGASYVIAVDQFDNMIYMLGMVSNFTTHPHFFLNKIPYGIKDAWMEGTAIPNFSLDKTDEYSGEFEDADLFVNKDKIQVRLKDRLYCICL